MIDTNIRKRRLSTTTTTLLALGLLAIPPMALAQTTPDPNAAANAEKARLEAETARINAEAARINAESARERARIDALHLPSFEGRTTLNQGAGAIEAAMLASHAINAAAVMIDRSVRAADPQGTAPPIVVLAGDEALDFGRIGALDAEMDAISEVFRQVGYPAPEVQSMEAGGVSATAVIAAVTAAAGLLRSNTEVTALDLSALSNRTLATAVAGQLGNRAVLPSAAIGTVTEPPTSSGPWTGKTLMQKLNDLVGRRRSIQAERDAIVLPDPTKPTQRYKDLTAALARFDAFAARVTTADANGAVPIVQAVRLEALWRQHPRVLRLYVDKAGGSLINRTNLLTTLAFSDPVRVSGGLIASFTLTDPATGGVLGADILTCRTTTSRLRSVQRGIWGEDAADARAEGAVCSGLSRPASSGLAAGRSR